MAESVATALNGASKPVPRSDSISQASETSQTAQDYIATQLQLEADAREALPYQFDTCTRPLGPLRQPLFSCLTCNPPPNSPSDPYHPAGVCYSCSISCHGEHTLVELFNKRNFVCECGTTRLPATSPCTLRMNETTKAKGGVIGETPVERNSYNQNFANRFCGCGEVYNAHTEKGTMFQCLGLGKPEEGGCGEDWWHPECVLGLPRNWHESLETTAQEQNAGEAQIPRKTTDTEAISGSARSEPAIELLESVTVTATSGATGTNQDAALETSVDEDVLVEDDDPPLPPGFPKEEDFEHFICYKCVNAFPWIKRYAGTPGFLPPVPYGPSLSDTTPAQPSGVAATLTPSEPSSAADFKKRKAMDDEDATAVDTPTLKRQKSESSQMPPPTSNSTVTNSPTLPACRYATLPPSPTYTLSLFLLPSFRNNLCHCALHFPLLPPHPALLDDEPTYEPPMSDSDAGGGARSVGTGSLLDRGEAALSNIDRVRAIEGVMAYNHVRDKVKAFLKPFAESGRMVGAEDIKAYFEKLRGDTVDGAGGGTVGEEGEGERKGEEEDHRREQDGY